MRIKQLLAFSILFFGTAMAQAEHWPTGYYKASSADAVYYYDDFYRWSCDVQNADQLTSYGATDQVMVVSDVTQILNLSATLGACPWPDGFYQVTGETNVYRLYPGNYCIVSTPEMLAAYGANDSVVVTAAGSDFTAHRTNLGECFWPTSSK